MRQIPAETLRTVDVMQQSYRVRNARYAGSMEELLNEFGPSADPERKYLADIARRGVLIIRLAQDGYEARLKLSDGEWQVVTDRGPDGSRSDF